LQTLSDCRDGSPTGHPTSVIVSLRSHQNAERPATPDSGRGQGLAHHLTQVSTHEVTNQSPALPEYNVFLADRALREGIAR